VLEWELETLGIREGYTTTGEQEHGEAIFLTSSFRFNSAEEAAARFSGELPGNVYSRFTNPTVRAFEKRLAALEGAESCVATASGMSAILALVMSVLSAGDHLVASRSLFGTTHVLFEKIMGRFGVKTSFVTLTQLEEWAAACTPQTKLFFIETPANPTTDIADMRALADLAHENGAWLAVDNCFCTPALQRPLEWGADFVIHSATKFLDGQGRCLGGAVLGNKELVGKEVYGFLRTAGTTMSPFNAWVFLKGLETLSLRMKAHSAHAMQVAQWLQAHPNVSRVNYPGLDSHPQYALGQAQMSASGGILSFEIAQGNKEKAFALINATRMLSITANLGDAKTTITHPATTTHGRVAPEVREKMGVSEGLIRLSVGLENPQDIINDLALGLERV
jgi:O-succinylhomoserine sulfhydrylase